MLMARASAGSVHARGPSACKLASGCGKLCLWRHSTRAAASHQPLHSPMVNLDCAAVSLDCAAAVTKPASCKLRPPGRSVAHALCHVLWNQLRVAKAEKGREMGAVGMLCHTRDRSPWY